MNIKGVEQYQLVGEKQFLSMAIVSGAILFSIGFLGVLLTYLSMLIGFAFFAFGILSVAALTVMGVNQEERRAKMAMDEYRQLPLDLLKRGSTSPELSSRTREAIISVLNQEHVGWSLQ